MSQQTNVSTFFDPEGQAEFWSKIDPDLQIYLDQFESVENWTYQFSELPELFIETASTLPQIMATNTMDDDQNNNDIIESLIPLISSMPYRQSLAALSWLDSNDFYKASSSWGLLIYLRTVQVVASRLEDDPDPFFLHCKTIYERVNVLLRAQITTKLFTQIGVFNS